MEKIFCKKCSQEKGPEDFYYENGKVSRPCKQCVKDRRVLNAYYLNKGLSVVEYKEQILVRREERKKRTEELSWATNLVKGLRKRGKKEKGKKIEVDMTINKDYILKLAAEQDFICYYSGLKMVVGDNFKAPSLDRIDSAKGYEKDNVVLCCRAMNYAKSEYDEESFRSFLTELKLVSGNVVWFS